MTKKMKKTRNRILAVLIMFVLLLILDHTGLLSNEKLNMPGMFFRPVIFVIYLIPYLIIGKLQSIFLMVRSLMKTS